MDIVNIFSNIIEYNRVILKKSQDIMNFAQTIPLFILSNWLLGVENLGGLSIRVHIRYIKASGGLPIQVQTWYT